MALMTTLAACTSEKTETISSGLSVRYLDACKPDKVEQIKVEALGDFATRESSFAAINVRDGTQNVDTLPIATRLFRLSVTTATFAGVAIARASDEDGRFEALILPRGQVCRSISQSMLLPTGAAVALAGDDDLLIAGGLNEPSASRDVERLHTNDGKSSRVTPGLFVARAGAAAVRVGQETWVLGGTQTATKGVPAFDSFERYDAQSDSLGSPGRLATPRTGLAALALANGDVWIAGGRKTEGGAALDSVERIPAGKDQGKLISGRMPFRLADGRLLARDDGAVLIVGESNRTLLLALLDPASGNIDELEPTGLDSSPELVVTLPGARIGFFEVDQAGKTTGVMALRLSNGDRVRIEGSLTSFAGLSDARALTLHNGQVLLTGMRNAEATARVIDPGTLGVRAFALARVPERLLLRDDGVALLVSANGLDVLRVDDRTQYDNPGGTLLATDSSVLALDAAGRWERDGLALRALETGARFDLGGLSYEGVEIEIEAAGEMDLLLRLENGGERTIQIGTQRVGPALCTIKRDPKTSLVITRERDQVRIENGDGRETCLLDGLLGRIAIGVRAKEQRSEVKRLVITRRE